MKRYLAGFVECGLDFLCHLFNHVGGCWLSFRGPLRRVYWWACEVNHPTPTDQKPDQAIVTTTPPVAGDGVWVQMPTTANTASATGLAWKRIAT